MCLVLSIARMDFIPFIGQLVYAEFFSPRFPSTFPIAIGIAQDKLLTKVRINTRQHL